MKLTIDKVEDLARNELQSAVEATYTFKQINEAKANIEVTAFVKKPPHSSEKLSLRKREKQDHELSQIRKELTSLLEVGDQRLHVLAYPHDEGTVLNIKIAPPADGDAHAKTAPQLAHDLYNYIEENEKASSDAARKGNKINSLETLKHAVVEGDNEEQSIHTKIVPSAADVAQHESLIQQASWDTLSANPKSTGWSSLDVGFFVVLTVILVLLLFVFGGILVILKRKQSSFQENVGGDTTV